MTDFTGSNTPADQRDLWRTPPALFASLDAEFCFQLDAAAAPHNALCRKFITAEQNTLETPWADYLSIPGYVWLNPPYSDITPFVKKAAAESNNQIGTVMLVPADTSVGWFKEAIHTASEVRFITAGRLAFINPVTGKPVSGNNKGSMLIIWHPYPRTHCHLTSVDRDQLMQFGQKLIARRSADQNETSTVWPAEVSLVYSQIDSAQELPSSQQQKLKSHINRMWLEKMPVPSIVTAARSLASAMENYA